MRQPEPNVLESFHRFIGQQLQTDAAMGMSPEQALAQWRERQETVAAIQEGLADVDAGRTKSLEEFDADFRKRHGIEVPQ
jgi:predicted transcriptional regulator